MLSAYLLSITLSGIKNIEKPVTLNFYKKTIDKNFDPVKYRVKAIYGENGAGKTALITGINIFREIILKNTYLADSANQRLLSELINKKSNCFSFECEYLIQNDQLLQVFRYSFSIAKNESARFKLCSEKLEKKNGNSANNVYHMVFSIEKGDIVEGKFGTRDEYIRKAAINLLKERPFIRATLGELTENIESDFETAFNIISIMILAIDLKVYLVREDRHTSYIFSKQVRLDDVSFPYDDLMQLLRTSDDFISNDDMNHVPKIIFDLYKEKVKKMTGFIQLFKRDLTDIEIDRKDNGDYYDCELVMNYDGYKINCEFESTGVRKLITLYNSLDAAVSGSIVFIDEMDANLNDVYLYRLIEYFVHYGKGQLCFTTHNIGPMDALQDMKNSIEFLSNDNVLTTWTKRGNSTPESCYRNGLIENLPFNISAEDFLSILGD